ncbi:MAG: GNAT family N-acetyltransferase [Cyanobacteria bacterium J06635_15]
MMMTSHDYRKIVFRRLTEVSPDVIIELMNDPDVRRHMPLAQGYFGVSDCERFVAAKERIWEENGYGPWAFFLGHEFIGWGGLQREGDDADVGLVLHRAHWGAGKAIYERILDHAFGELGLDSVIALFPPSRTRLAGLRRLGFGEDGQVMIGEELFNRYRLPRSARRQ